MSWRSQQTAGRWRRALALVLACVAIKLPEGSCHTKCEKGTHQKCDSGCCRTCPSGFYQDHKNKWSCKRCHNGKGTLAPTEGQKKKDFCEDCVPGRFDNRAGGAGYCERCPSGKFQKAKSELRGKDKGEPASSTPSVAPWSSVRQRKGCSDPERKKSRFQRKSPFAVDEGSSPED